MIKKYALIMGLASLVFLGGCFNKKTQQTTPTSNQQQTQVTPSTTTGNQQSQGNSQSQNQNQLQNEFGDLTPFIKPDLTTGEKEKLLEILDKRSVLQGEIQALESYEWDKIIRLRELKQQREQIRQQLLPFVDPQKVDKFNNYCNQLWEKVQNKYIKPMQAQQPQAPAYTMEEVKQHNKPGEDCRTVVNWAVYDITSWFSTHPGGAQALNPLCGTDGTQLFMEKHGNNPKAAVKLESFRIGILKD